MTTPELRTEIVGGVDTHKHTHTVAALDTKGRLLATAEFPASVNGYGLMLSWFQDLGDLSRVGIEATGSYGAGLTRYFVGEGVEVVEVLRPNRQLRRRRGKSDPTDAEAAARATLSGEAAGTPKSADGAVEAMRMIRLARSSAIKARTQTANQLHAVVGTAPDRLREPLRDHSIATLVHQARRWRPCEIDGPYSACRATLTLLARRWKHLDDEIHRYDRELERLTRQRCPRLLELVGVGPEVASCLMVAAGDNPERLRSEASFAALCGVSPLDASSGRQRRHRLNRGGNREANRALWTIAFIRYRVDLRTKIYAARRTKQGRTRPEITRCLKRYIAREVYRVLVDVAKPEPIRA